MSRKNWKKNPVPQSRLAPTPPLKPINQAELDARQNRWIKLCIAGNVASFLLNVALAWFAWSSSQSAQHAVDLVSGKVRAGLEFVDQKGDEARLKEFMRKKDGEDSIVFRIESADELMRWGPYIQFKNGGADPIDAIKIEVKWEFGAPYGAGVKQILPPPIIVNEKSDFEMTGFGKLDSEKTAKVHLAPLLLQQITRLDFKQFAEKDSVGMFSVTAYGRLAGALSYDQMSGKPRVFTFHWRPAGFKSNASNVKELLAKKPWIELD
ncbi:hypothetical protein BH10PLA2_BH10PLA2_00980 [soil metagenome]